MSAPAVIVQAPAVALSREQAAAALGYSIDHFEKHVQHEIRVIQRGRRIVVPVTELQRWADENAERILDPKGRR